MMVGPFSTRRADHIDEVFRWCVMTISVRHRYKQHYQVMLNDKNDCLEESFCRWQLAQQCLTLSRPRYFRFSDYIRTVEKLCQCGD